MYINAHLRDTATTQHLMVHPRGFSPPRRVTPQLIGFWHLQPVPDRVHIFSPSDFYLLLRVGAKTVVPDAFGIPFEADPTPAAAMPHNTALPSCCLSKTRLAPRYLQLDNLHITVLIPDIRHYSFLANTAHFRATQLHTLKSFPRRNARTTSLSK